LGHGWLAGTPRDARAFVLCASAIAECQRQRVLPSDGRPMRLIDNALVAILLRITLASFTTVHQQCYPSETIFSGCGSCDFADFASNPSCRCEFNSNV
jgi:hypothetical protein